MMQIQAVKVYRVNARDFETLAKAKDHVDELVNKILTKALTEKGFTISECIKITDSVLSVREDLANLLLVEFEDNY